MLKYKPKSNSNSNPTPKSKPKSNKLLYTEENFPELGHIQHVSFNETDLNTYSEGIQRFKRAVLEKVEDNDKSLFQKKKGWIEIFNGFIENTDNTLDMESYPISIRMAIAVRFMSNNWEKNKEYDLEMMSPDYYTKIYKRSEIVYDSDIEDEDYEGNVYYDYEYDDDY